MPGSRGRRLAAILAAGAIVATAAGCQSKSSEGGSPPDNAAQGAPQPPRPLLDGWTQPAAAIVFTGEQDGFLEPCGCTELQSGGMGRRHALFEQIRAKGWPLTGLDLGGTVRRSRLQDQLKFQAILAGMDELGYAAMALGTRELRLGADYVLSRENFSPESDAAPTFVAANVVLFESPDYGPARSRIVHVGNVRIGVTAVLGTSFASELFPEGAQTNIEVSDPVSSLAEVLEVLKADQPDLLVLLSHASLDESQQLAARFPEFDVVATTGGPEDPDGKPERVGDTLLIKVGRKGKYAGVVGFYPDAGNQPAGPIANPSDERRTGSPSYSQRLRFELVNLDRERFTETAAMRQLMQAYQDELRDQTLEVFLDLPRGTHPRGATFVGAARCGECHGKAYNKWKSTAHAHATESLLEGREDEKYPIARIHDPECLACHVTGWHPQEVSRYVSGYLSEVLVSDATKRAALEAAFAAAGREETLAPDLFDRLRGQQCENCHGPGSEHVRLETLARQNRNAVDPQELAAGRRAMHLTRSQAREHLCIQCHDHDNSPNFDFEKYWDKVKHPWRD